MPPAVSQHPCDRRTFLTRGTTALTAGAALAAWPSILRAEGRRQSERLSSVQDPQIKDALLLGVEAAEAAGASYADVRLTHTIETHIDVRRYMPWTEEAVYVNVRALVDGCWGFAAGPDVSRDALAQLGRQAVALAKANRNRKTHTVELAPAPVVTGHWETPITIDPATLHLIEMYDQLRGLTQHMALTPNAAQIQPEMEYHHTVTEKAFGSTAGSYCTQRVHQSYGVMRAGMQLVPLGITVAPSATRWLGRSAAGFELITGQPLRQRFDEAVEAIRQYARLTPAPVEPGRYDMLFSPALMSELVSKTIGWATQADRAFGYEAHELGTSYVTDPVGMLGTLQLGAPQLTVTANRSEPGGLATCRWDDEGVAPVDFSLVTNGVLADLQSGRESASWLQPVYAKTGRAVRSHGCAYAPTAEHAPGIHTPNLMLAPGAESQTFETLQQGMTDGLAFTKLIGSSGGLDVDVQQRSGQWFVSNATVIKRGKAVGRAAGRWAIQFRTPELLRGILALGGPASAERTSWETGRSREAMGYHSVTTVPTVIKQVTVYDPTRR